MADELSRLEPGDYLVLVDDELMDRITEAFGMVVDAKSPHTHAHSARVAVFSTAIGTYFGFDPQRLRWLRRAAYLHDLGKLGVSNAILDKPGKLDAAEWAEVRRHPQHTAEILGRLAPFESIALLSGAHHEKLDGTGYPRGVSGRDITVETRIITLCDIFDALTATRPYREAMPVPNALGIIRAQLGTAIDPDCFEALRAHVRDTGMHQARHA